MFFATKPMAEWQWGLGQPPCVPPLLDYCCCSGAESFGFYPKTEEGGGKSLARRGLTVQGKSHQCFHYLKVCCKLINEAPAYFGLLVCQRNKAAVL